MKIQSSYNSYLAQQCSIRVVNQRSTPQVARLSMTRYDATQVIDRERLSIPAPMSLELCYRSG